LCSILHDFNWQRAGTVPLHQQSFLYAEVGNAKIISQRLCNCDVKIIRSSYCSTVASEWWQDPENQWIWLMQAISTAQPTDTALVALIISLNTTTSCVTQRRLSSQSKCSSVYWWQVTSSQNWNYPQVNCT